MRLAGILSLAALLHAQSSDLSNGEPAGLSGANRYWLSGQLNSITQYHASFQAKYSGPNSFGPESEAASSRVLTLFSGVRITKNTEFLFDLESAGGSGISNALGLAGFTNLDVVRNPTLGSAPYISRVMLHEVVPLSSRYEDVIRGPLNLASKLPVRRLEFRLGRMSTVDFFDANAIGSDSHLQFMNWAADNNPAYDYAADTRGYTYGFVAEFYDHNYVLRFGEMLMPKTANGLHLDADLARARGQNLEFELHPELFQNRETVVRVLSYLNIADMGSYRAAIRAFRAGAEPTPDITAVERQGRKKYGFGLNVEQTLLGGWRAYARLGWNDGRNESFAYTECDRFLGLGSDLRGNRWGRPQDKLGSTFLLEGLSGDHRTYLALGGLGFILGDGALNYGHETIWETYYTLHVWRGVSLSGDLQQIWNPGYNRGRGPATVYSFRFHIEDGVNLGEPSP